MLCARVRIGISSRLWAWCGLLIYWRFCCHRLRWGRLLGHPWGEWNGWSMLCPWFCQKSCTDKALCSISYLTEILTKRVFFRHFCKSVKGPVFTGLFGPFYALQMLDIAHFFGKYFPLSSYMFSYLSKSFNRSKSVCLNGRVSSNLTACAKKGHILCPFIFLRKWWWGGLTFVFARQMQIECVNKARFIGKLVCTNQSTTCF